MSSMSSITSFPSPHRPAQQTVFLRDELSRILDIYGRMVAAGEWRDYAIDCAHEEAVFRIYRRSSEMPLYRIVKRPAMAAKQGAYAVIAMDGRILKRGAKLEQVLQVFNPALRKVEES